MAALERTETILVVDDQAAVLTLMQGILTRHGYTAVLASSAGEVLQLFKTKPDVKVDLALIDIVMPRMDGLELAEKLRQIRPELPIVYMSSYPDWRESPLVKGAAIPCIGKPFTSLTLLQLIRGMLDETSGREPSQGSKMRSASG